MKNKIIALLLCLLTFVSLLPLSVFAAESSPFDTSDVLTDLEGCTVNGDIFVASNYPSNDYARSPEVLAVNEYGYGTDSFNLYIYVYMPYVPHSEKPYYSANNNKLTTAWLDMYDRTTADRENRVQTHLLLETVDISECQRFIKFKVKEPDKIPSVVSQGTRTYFVNYLSMDWEYTYSTEADPDVLSPTAYSGVKYMFQGSDATGDKVAYSLGEDTVNLNIYPIHYRTATSDKGTGYAYDVLSVYFSVPKEYWDKYDRIQSITGDWYEYRANVVVTNNANAYSLLEAVENETVSSYDKNKPSLYTQYSSSGMISAMTAFKAFNAEKTVVVPALNNIPKIHDVIYKDYTPSEDGEPQYLITDPNDIENWEISPLAGNKNGYTSATILFDETYDLNSLTGVNGTNHSWFQKLWFDLEGVDETQISGAPKICTLDWDKMKDYRMDDGTILSSFAKDFLIDMRYADEVLNFVESENAQGNTVVKLVFAVRDYYSGYVQVRSDSKDLYKAKDKNVFLAESYFADDFGIIQMSFWKDAQEFAFPVVSNRVDVWGGISTPTDGEPFPEFEMILNILKIVAVLAAVVVVLILWQRISPVFKIVTAPIKKAIRKNKRSDKEQK